MRVLRAWPWLVLAALAAIALGAPWLAPFDPRAQPDIVGAASLPPGAAHWFGTDHASRDVLSRMLWGARVSLGVAALAVGVALTLGTAIGAIAALAGGWIDALLMRLTDVVFAIPRLLLLLLLVASFGALSPVALALILGATGWMTTGRLVRQETRRLLATEHVRTARALGVPWPRLLRAHLLPGILPTLAAAGSIALAAAVPLEAGLSYLGLGVRAPMASWGSIILDAEGRYLGQWWMVLFPTLAIVVTVLAANGLAERFSDAAARER